MIPSAAKKKKLAKLNGLKGKPTGKIRKALVIPRYFGGAYFPNVHGPGTRFGPGIVIPVPQKGKQHAMNIDEQYGLNGE